MKLSAFISLCFAVSAPPVTSYLLADNSAAGWACALFILWAWAFLFSAAWFYRCVCTHTQREAIERWERTLRDDGHPTNTTTEARES